MRKIIEFLKGQRKVFIFMLFIGASMVATTWMGVSHYKIYIDGLMIVSVAFFAGNGVEHITTAITNRMNKKIDPPEPPSIG